MDALSPGFSTFLIAFSPIIELRGAIPIAVTVFDLPLATALALSIVGNILAIPVVYVFLLFGVGAARRMSRSFDTAFQRYVERVRRRFHARYERWGIVALILFVATPLPGTGAWTGTVAGWLVGMRFRSLFLAASIGVIIAAGVVTIMTFGAQKTFSLFL